MDAYGIYKGLPIIDEPKAKIGNDKVEFLLDDLKHLEEHYARHVGYLFGVIGIIKAKLNGRAEILLITSDIRTDVNDKTLWVAVCRYNADQSECGRRVTFIKLPEK